MGTTASSVVKYGDASSETEHKIDFDGFDAGIALVSEKWHLDAKDIEFFRSVFEKLDTKYGAS